jgi:uncharacterized protein (DUF1800 family)
MRLGRVKFAAPLLCVSLACTVPQVLAGKKDKPVPQPDDQKGALHALNRLTFGPRPGDLQAVMAMGVDRWIDLQLHPERIDDSALNLRLEPFLTLRMNTREIAEDFPDPQEINQVANGKKAMPSDPVRRAIYEVQIARREERKELQEEMSKAAPAQVGSAEAGFADSSSMAANKAPETGAEDRSGKEMMNSGANQDASDAMSTRNDDANLPPAKLTPEEKEQARLREEKLYTDLDVQQLPNLAPDERYKKILSMPPDAQYILANQLRGGKGQEFLEGLNPRQKETLMAMNNPALTVMSELMQAKLLRAIYSQRQLEEVITDFWCNHFNVFIDKGLDRILLTSYERDVIRPHALGKFEDLLVATAKSPAMLFYLDNFMSVGPNSPQTLGLPLHPGSHARRFPPRPNPGKRPSGLNENYGRELLELHTLSVNGGYSQRDVTEVAKVFTGWTIDKPAEGGSFKFEPRMHEPGPKFVMGHKIKPNGEGEGLELLHRLATNPHTAHFISLKLAQRFVSDDPPPALVDRMAKTFLKKKGDIREVLSTLFHSPEFWDETTYRAKVKTPLEFVVSAVRATSADVEDALPLTRQLANMGMPLYGAQPPTGYSMKAETWVSSSALLNRMNFAIALTSGKIKGVKPDAAQLAGEISQPGDSLVILPRLEEKLLAGGVSQQTHDSIVAQIQATKKDSAQTIAGLLLGSPEFQRR